MDFDQYQTDTAKTAIYPAAFTGSERAITYCTLGLAGEAGEVANKAKKLLRDPDSAKELREAILVELGDVLWYLARLADELEQDLGNIARSNIDRLLDRKARGVIGGSGDSR